MALAQKIIGSTTYYTDGVTYYTFHIVRSKSDALWKFACMDLGINKTSGFSTDETARINDLAGTGTQKRAKYLLLKNGQAVPIQYHITGNPLIQVNDIILRQVAPPAVGLVKCPHCASQVQPGPTCSACGRQLSA